MVVAVVQNSFDWSMLDSDTRAFVQEKTEAILARLKRTAEDVIAIGQNLIEVKARLQHGQYEDWLQSEFDMSQRTARRFMQCAERFGGTKTAILAATPNILYELVNSDEIIVEMVETGQIPATLPAIREAKRASDPVEVREVPVSDAPAYGEYLEGEVHPSPEQPVFPPGWGLVDGKPFTIPLPDGKPIDREEIEKVFPPLHSEPRRNTDGVPLAVPHIISKNNEWYTPSKYIEAARRLMEEITLDPASCEEANRTVRATTYYDIDTNGLAHDWHGKVWLNPPYGFTDGRSNQDIWSNRLIEQCAKDNIEEAVLLVNAAVDTNWFHRLFDYPVCLTRGRINFTTPETTVSGSTHGSAFVYFGSHPEKFSEIFCEFGTVVKRW